MKIIIYITHSEMDGIQVRHRSSDRPGFHLLECGHFDTIEDAQEYAEVFQRGAELADASTVLAYEEGTDEVEDLPSYGKIYMSGTFEDAWTELTGEVL